LAPLWGGKKDGIMDERKTELTISHDVVGAKLATVTKEVAWRETTNYAAAVADPNPLYLDDTQPGALLAPPMFVVALTWPVMSNLAEQLGDLLDPRVMPRIVHASEHLVFHRPIKPGDKLTLTGECVALLPTPAGTLLVLRIDGHDQNGEPVFTEFTAPMFRGVSCPEGPTGKANLPMLPQFAPADAPLWEARETICREAPFVYDGCTDIVFAIHTSVGFATAVGLPDIILQGTATLAKAAREVLNREAGGQPARLKELACRFTGLVQPGTDIRVQLTHRETDDEESLLGFQVLNDQNQVAISHGYAKIC
jgi:acyl dehydratase